MEIYSPGGGCSQTFGNVPVGNLASIVGWINGKITYCSTVFDNRFQFYFY
jgi:hypothetical protein